MTATIAIYKKTKNKGKESDLGKHLDRFLATTIGKLLGTDISADIYAKNGFRLLSVPANVERLVFESSLQRFKSLYKLSEEKALKTMISTGYDDAVKLKKAAEFVSNLQSTRKRFVYELFWFHLPETIFNKIKSSKQLVSNDILDELGREAKGEDENAILSQHALAILYTNKAIANELSYSRGEAEQDIESWRLALDYWAAIQENPLFWTYLQKRIKGFDDIKLKSDDLDEVRKNLPAVILGFNMLFAKKYSDNGYNEKSLTHINLIQKSAFASEIKTQQLSALVTSITIASLNPIKKDVQRKLAEFDDKLTRKEYDAIYQPAINETFKLYQYLIDDLGVSEETVRLGEFDHLCEMFLASLEDRIDYTGEDRTRAILYSTLVCLQMLKLPVSTSLKRKMEKNRKGDRKCLYDEFLGKNPDDINQSECWFLNGQLADPDASIVMRLYKIDDCNGTRISWNKRTILIPRSKLAKDIHDGKVDAKDLANNAEDEKSKAITKKIKEEISESTAKIKALTTEAKNELVPFEEKQGSETSKYNKKIKEEENKIRHLVEPTEAERDKIIRAEEKRVVVEFAKIESKYNRPAKKLSDRHTRISSNNSGIFGSYIQAFLLVSFIGVAVMGVILYQLPLTNANFVTFGAGLGFSLLMGLLLSRLLSLTKIEISASKVNKLDKKIMCKKNKLKSESNKITTDARAKAKIDLEGIRKDADAVINEWDGISSQIENKLKEIRTKSEAKTKELEAQSKKCIESLEKKLMSYFSVKKLSGQKAFPIYQRAKSQGYRDGVDPSDSEIDRIATANFDRFMDRLSDLDRLVLRTISSQLGDDKMKDVINQIVELSDLERLKRFAELRKALLGY